MDINNILDSVAYLSHAKDLGQMSSFERFKVPAFEDSSGSRKAQMATPIPEDCFLNSSSPHRSIIDDSE
jgi:hypothetical protein